MSQQSTTSQSKQSQSENVGSVMPFEGISEPGAYVANWSGHLIRVPEDGLAQGRSPQINLVGTEPLTVTKISDNPYITITKAKMLACNCDLHVNF